MEMSNVILVLAADSASCATTQTPTTTAAAEEPSPAPVHHHHHHPHHNLDGSSGPPDGEGTATSFGTPLAPTSHEQEIVPRWDTGDGSDARIVCEGNERIAAPECPQCADAPGSAAIVRAFVPAENAVLRCQPPANPLGRLPVRVTFTNAGVPLEVRFPGVQVEEDVAICLGHALCGARVPTFQSPSAAVNYEYVVLLPEHQ